MRDLRNSSADAQPWLQIGMPDLTFYQWANALKGYALAVGVAFAIAMIIVWWRRSRADVQLERSVRAQALYGAFLLEQRQMFRDAEMRPGSASALLATSERLEFTRYLLSVCNQIMLLDRAAGWHRPLCELLESHRPALAALHMGRDMPPLQPDVRALVEEVMT